MSKNLYEFRIKVDFYFDKVYILWPDYIIFLPIQISTSIKLFELDYLAVGVWQYLKRISFEIQHLYYWNCSALQIISRQPNNTCYYIS